MGIKEIISGIRVQVEKEQQEAQRLQAATKAEFERWHKSRLDGCNSFLERVQARKVFNEVNRELLNNRGKVEIKPAVFEQFAYEVLGFDGTEYRWDERAIASCSLNWKTKREKCSIEAVVITPSRHKSRNRLRFRLSLSYPNYDDRPRQWSLSCFDDEDPKTADIVLDDDWYHPRRVDESAKDAKEHFYLRVAEVCEALQRHKLL